MLGVLVAKVLGVKTNIGIRLIIIIIYWPGNWVKYSGKVLEKFWKIIGKNVWEPCNKHVTNRAAVGLSIDIQYIKPR